MRSAIVIDIVGDSKVPAVVLENVREGLELLFRLTFRSWLEERELISVEESVSDGIPKVLRRRLLGRRSSSKVLILTTVDLRTCRRQHVAGMAEFGGRIAVVSLRGLCKPRDDLDLGSVLPNFDRLVCEAAHEIGHLFQLDHCAQVHCIMGVRDGAWWRRPIQAFCPVCQQRLERALPPQDSLISQ